MEQNAMSKTATTQPEPKQNLVDVLVDSYLASVHPLAMTGRDRNWMESFRNFAKTKCTLRTE
jgi:hypothetical protein